MSRRATPPFRADHVGSLLRPAGCCCSRARTTRRAARRDGAARGRGRGIRDGGADAGGRRPASRHRRRVPPRLLAHGLPLPVGGVNKVPDDIKVQFQQREGRHRVHPGGAPGRRQAPPRRADLRRGLHLPEIGRPRPRPSSPSRRRAWCTTAAAARRSIRVSIPTSRNSGDDLAAVYADEIAALGKLGCTYLQLDDTSLAYLNDPAQREHIAQARRRRRRAPASHLHPA